jgi:hypothetical protein
MGQAIMGQAIMGHKSRLFVGATALLPLLFGCSQSPAADCEVALGKKGAAEDGEYFEIDPVSLSATALTCVGDFDIREESSGSFYAYVEYYYEQSGGRSSGSEATFMGESPSYGLSTVPSDGKVTLPGECSVAYAVDETVESLMEGNGTAELYVTFGILLGRAPSAGFGHIRVNREEIAFL